MLLGQCPPSLRIKTLDNSHPCVDNAQVYYYNTVTGDSAWEAPEGYTGGAPGADGSAGVPVSTTLVKGTAWSEVACSDGKTYWFNSATKVRAGLRGLQWAQSSCVIMF